MQRNAEHGDAIREEFFFEDEFSNLALTWLETEYAEKQRTQLRWVLLILPWHENHGRPGSGGKLEVPAHKMRASYYLLP